MFCLLPGSVNYLVASVDRLLLSAKLPEIVFAIKKLKGTTYKGSVKLNIATNGINANIAGSGRFNPSGNGYRRSE